MQRNIRYLALGFIIGTSATAATIVAAMVWTARASPVPTASALPTLPPEWSPTSPTMLKLTATTPPTAFPQPLLTIVQATQTPDALQVAMDSGAVIFSGPLSNAQQLRLYAASLRYVQATAKDSKREAKEINGVGYGDPTNICGPLALAILRDAGLAPLDIAPHDFWLLNPTAVEDQRKLAHVFPPERYSHTRVSTALNKMDWVTNPLQPGDFLFIWHGSGGNFDHMLVVNRVDRANRAYAVTNFGTPDGYVIAETMLYDPNDPLQGIFHTWTKEQHAILGSTGFGGFELWRLVGS